MAFGNLIPFSNTKVDTMLIHLFKLCFECSHMNDLMTKLLFFLLNKSLKFNFPNPTLERKKKCVELKVCFDL